MNAFARVLDRLLWALRLPTAIVALVLAPGLVYALFFLIRGVVATPHAALPFLVGGVLCAVAWLALEPRRNGAWTTVEHELTHALFAWLTCHRVIGFGAALRSGGHIRYTGKGNWLIAIAPFFFPTLSLAAILVLTLAPRHHLVIGGFVLGVTTAYHVFSSWSKSHRHHADLRECGWLFSTVFLIASNAFVLGLVIAYACGLRSLTGYLEHVRGPSTAFFHWLVHFLPGG